MGAADLGFLSLSSGAVIARDGLYRRARLRCSPLRLGSASRCDQPLECKFEPTEVIGHVDALQLTQRLTKLRPHAEPAEQLRLALLLALQSPDLNVLGDDQELERHCQKVDLLLSATSDQHAAVTDELDSLATTAPCDFSPDHLWTLVRAIKVQNQILHLYLGPADASV